MRLLHALAGLAGIAALAHAAGAAQHPKAICDDLKAELALHQKNGVAADMAKGVAWAKANASRDRLKEIERLIHVEEQLAFRCPQPKKPLAPGEDEDGTTAAAPGKAKTAKAPAKPAAKATAAADDEPAAPPPRKTVKKAAAADEPPAPAPAAAQPAPRKAKPKTEDAYSPAAAGQPTSGPFKTN